MNKHILLGLGIAAACAAALNAFAVNVQCSVPQVGGPAQCTELTTGWTGKAQHSGVATLSISLFGGNAVTHPARASSIAQGTNGVFSGSDQVVTSVQNPNPSDTRTFSIPIVTQDMLMIAKK
jgi:hypothetical protein